VLRTACEQLVIWRQQWPTLTVAVNVAHSELRDPGFTRNVARILADTGLPGRALHLEITETVLVAHDDLRRVLETLRALDVEFAIDDFGTGQSSLSRLRDLPVRRLKIDRSFMSEIGTNDQAPLLASIIGLAHSLGRIVIAEGRRNAAAGRLPDRTRMRRAPGISLRVPASGAAGAADAERSLGSLPRSRIRKTRLLIASGWRAGEVIVARSRSITCDPQFMACRALRACRIRSTPSSPRPAVLPVPRQPLAEPQVVRLLNPPIPQQHRHHRPAVRLPAVM
jgi:hypothetical protein